MGPGEPVLKSLRIRERKREMMGASRSKEDDERPRLAYSENADDDAGEEVWSVPV